MHVYLEVRLTELSQVVPCMHAQDHIRVPENTVSKN